MAAVLPSTDTLNPFFAGLKTRNEQTRAQSARDLSLYISNVVADMPSETAKDFDQVVNKKIFDLAHSGIPEEQYGGLAAIDAFLDIPIGDTYDLTRLYRYFGYAKAPLPSSDTNVTVAASKVLSRIAALGGSVFGEAFVEQHVAEAIQTLQRSEQGRYGAVLLLRELARNLPLWFATHVALVFEKLIIGFRDPRANVREATGELLAACLDILTSREREHDLSSRQLLIKKVLDDIKLPTAQPPPVNIHGTLVAYRNLLLHGAIFMRDHYQAIGEDIYRFKGNRDILVRQTVVSLIPTLAMYDVTLFTENFMHRCMGHLQSLLDKPAERSRAFIAIGHVAQAVGGEMKHFLEPIMQSVKAGLQQHGRRGAPLEEPIFQCVGMLATAVGPNLTKLLHDLLGPMFNCGLSEALRQALVAIARFIPPLLRTIQDRLLNLISMILSGAAYKPVGAPVPAGRNDLSSITKEFRVSASASTNDQVILALTTLGTFDFTGHVLNEFVRNCSLPYVEDDLPEIRQAAALTCCRLFVRDPIVHQSSSHSLEVINDVLDKLLTVGIADPDPEIRETVLLNLDEQFDKHLAQAENVRSLFIALNDEIFENRIIATKLIGRLAMHNPAYAMPSLRKAVLQLMTELEYSTVSRNREECIRLLTLLIGATQRLIKPYALTMIDTLLPKAYDPNPAVAANVLLALGELSAVGGEDVTRYVPRLMEIILSILEDPNVVAKRDAALKALGQICSSTGYVIQPLVDYPQMLTVLGKILKTEQNHVVRREVMKLLGILGALDPYKRLTKPEESARDNAAVNQIPLTKPSHLVGEDYFQNVVISSLLGILKDNTLSSNHHHVIDAIMSIFKTQGLRSVAHLPQIFPAFTLVARTAPARQQDYYLQQLAILIEIVKEHVRNYVPELLKMIVDLWDHVALQLPIVSVIEALGKALDAEFKPFLPAILPSILRIFEADLTEKRQQTQTKVFSALLTLGSNVEEYMHLIIPIIVKTFERTDASVTLRKSAIVCIEGLSRRINFSDHASRIIHPMVRTLGTASNELRSAVMEALCALVSQLGCDFAIFVPTINKALAKHKISYPRYDNLIKQLLKGERVTHDVGAFDLTWNDANKTSDFALPVMTKLTVNQQHLKQAWDVSNLGNQEDWNEWIHKLSVEFLKESPSHALRACMTLVESYHALARELFNAAFYSCWTELYESYQEDLVRAVEFVITAANVPPDVVHRMLNLAEFMEQKNLTLPIPHKTLGDCALQYHAYAKALHHKEIDALQDISAADVEALIGINTRLQQHDAAWGTLLMAQDEFDIAEHENWYERLSRWQDALDAWNRRAEAEPTSLEVFNGRMRCLHALGEWQQLSQNIDNHWISAEADVRRELAPMAAAAAWSLNEWDAMDDYISTMKVDSPDRAFYKAILAIHKAQYPRALTQITRARDLLDPELTSLVGDNYGRTYTMMTKAQALSELEEIIAYKQYADEPDRQRTMRKTWMKRLQGCQPDVEVWQRILQVRSLVLHSEEDSQMWIKFGNLCRKAKRYTLAEKTFNSLIPANGSNAPPEVVYAQLKLDWAEEPSERCLEYLRAFTSTLRKSLDTSGHSRHQVRSLEEQRHLLARCYFKLGEWEVTLKENWNASNVKEVLQAYHRATQYDPEWYKAWHSWALANFEVVNYMDNRGDGGMGEMNDNQLSSHIVSAIQGFFQSISLRSKKVLQDTLRLLTLWFKYGDHDEVSKAMSAGFATVDIITWLDVVPQIIARIQTPSANIFRNINFLLADIARQHPQSLIAPLTVAAQSPSSARRLAALDIMNIMRQHSPVLVEQSRVVSEELLRVAILWHEMWHEGLEEASRYYYTEHNVEAMLGVLEPLHAKVEAGAQTARESSFVQVFGRDLLQAKEACRRFRVYGQQRDIDEAWQIYYGVFKKIERQLPQLMTLDLHYVSPQLEKLTNLDMAVPGSYVAGQTNIITIANFSVKMTVLATKQRPRRFTLRGSDGRDYEFLLKGHEDLRQDERVMQLFSLVNDLLAVDADSFKRRLHIQRYPVVPLAPNAGLIGWAQGTETLHALIRDYRETHKILADIERRLMMQMSVDHEILTSMQKLEVFEHAVNHSTGQDVYRSLWEKSNNSEHWLERRATYTSSLAVNSMIGHVLGLGDRHPSNILLESDTGKIVHIDFGDCFEVAMHREKYPERVPFRLTRMLRRAMEVSGIRGSFRITSEITMRVLRENRESLMAVLEALVYDPLISWRLVQPDQPTGTEARVTREGNAPARRAQANEEEIFKESAEEHPARTELRNERALRVYNRVKDKLTGRDFDPNNVLPVEQQVDRLIRQAQDNVALSQHFTGWCAFW